MRATRLFVRRARPGLYFNRVPSLPATNDGSAKPLAEELSTSPGSEEDFTWEADAEKPSAAPARKGQAPPPGGSGRAPHAAQAGRTPGESQAAAKRRISRRTALQASLIGGAGVAALPLIALAGSVIRTARQPTNLTYSMNTNWLFGDQYMAGSESSFYDDSNFAPIALPHNVTSLQ